MSTIKAAIISDELDNILGVNNVIQGSAKAWISGTLAAVINDSHNVSSSVDNGIGDYSYNYINTLLNANGAGAPCSETNSPRFGVSVKAAGSQRLYMKNDAGGAADIDHSVVIHGDLAP